jgi:hypothetical protein
MPSFLSSVLLKWKSGNRVLHCLGQTVRVDFYPIDPPSHRDNSRLLCFAKTEATAFVLEWARLPEPDKG